MNENLRQSLWNKTRMLIKGGIILALLLIFLIPAHYIEELVLEREATRQSAVAEVTSKWSGSQQLTGPVLVVPYTEAGTAEGVRIRKYAFFLPDTLIIDGEIIPEKKHRGIYEVMLYRASAKVEGHFSKLPVASLHLAPEQMLWDQAYLKVQLSDMRGLSNDLYLNWNGNLSAAVPGNADNANGQNTFIAPVTVSPDIPHSFSFNAELKGSGSLMFTTIGKGTDVRLRSAWRDPSFIGSELPQHEVTDNGFTARWKTLAHGRNFPQAWKDQLFSLSNAAVGTELFIPVNAYQKTLRSVKYASLLILLTFVAFFLVETLTRQSVHPLHYALIGIALILFYTLLLSLSEHILFNAAYAAAAAATILLITAFARSILQSGKWGTVMGVVLVLLYGYIFSILQLQDYSLLLGSIGLFVTLAVGMYFMRKLRW